MGDRNQHGLFGTHRGFLKEIVEAMSEWYGIPEEESQKRLDKYRTIIPLLNEMLDEWHISEMIYCAYEKELSVDDWITSLWRTEREIERLEYESYLHDKGND